MKNFNKALPIALTLAISTLTACGGGSSESSTPAPVSTTPPAATMHNYSGKVIDGYVVGATIFLDINGNGKLEPSIEPNTVSTASGDYTLELTDEQNDCALYVPVVVDVPVGAYDEDEGTVEEAYQMILPPPVGNYFLRDNGANVTPLSTVVWEMVQSDYQVKDSDMTTMTRACAAVKANHENMSKLGRQIKEVVKILVDNYNISEDKIFTDYIAAGDTATGVLAVDIVKGLKKSFSQTKEHRARNANADVARVIYMKENGSWTRNSYTFTDGNKSANASSWTPHSSASQAKHRVSDDLETVGSVISSYARSMLGRNFSGKKVYVGAGSDECSTIDYYWSETTDYNRYFEIANNTSHCADINSTKMVFNTTWTNSDARIGSGAQFLVSYDEETGSYPVLDHLVDFKADRNGLNPELVNNEIESFLPATKGSLDQNWLNDNFRTVVYWSFYNSGGNRIEEYERLQSGEYVGERKIIASNGTHTKECRPTDNDAWTGC
jgi:hypothetical protein